MSRLKFIILFSYLISVLNIYGTAAIDNTKDDGYDLWLRYKFVEDDNVREYYLSYFKSIQLPSSSETIEVIKNELSKAFEGLFSVDFEDLGVASNMDKEISKGSLKYNLLKKKGKKIGNFISTE